MYINTIKKHWVRLTISFILVTLMLFTAYLLFFQYSITQSKERALAIAYNETSIIKDRMNLIFARDYTLRNLIIADNGSTHSFDSICENIFNEVSECGGISIKNIAIAPDCIVEKIYPLEPNKALIGFDFTDATKAGNQEAIECYQKGELVITNPFSLVQGGTGIAGRLPVFIGEGDNSRFWGLVTITIDYDEFINAMDFNAIEESGYLYSLWYADNNGKRVVISSSDAEALAPITQSFNIANLEWNLDVAPINGWCNNYEFIIIMLVIIGFALLIFVLETTHMKIKDVNKKLEALVQIDTLSNCYSRQYAKTVLVDQKTGNWNDSSVQYSMAMIDIDYFKTVNDTYGHENGDIAIVAVAKVLMGLCEPKNGDCVIRYGGDEFIILFNNVTKEIFEEKLRCIITQVEQLRFEKTPDMQLTVSIGADMYSSKELSTFYNQLHNADEKLYLEKSYGRNRYQI